MKMSILFRIWVMNSKQTQKIIGDDDSIVEDKSETNPVEEVNTSIERLWQKYSSNIVFICFFILGFCNSAPFMIMLSAAHDILSEENEEKNYENNT